MNYVKHIITAIKGCCAFKRRVHNLAGHADDISISADLNISETVIRKSRRICFNAFSAQYIFVLVRFCALYGVQQLRGNCVVSVKRFGIFYANLASCRTLDFDFDTAAYVFADVICIGGNFFCI